MSEDEDCDFKSVSPEVWTSFNSWHTKNNMDTLNWALEKGLDNNLGIDDFVVDFGCG